ncbi:MAG: enoyl-CoA hydratase/isomerase family protein [bacterium]|nr:enoyl-CoA hydratase/isomerase family protein [bacterium]
MLDLTRDGDVSILRLDGGENRFTPPLMEALERALDAIEGGAGPAAVVLTGTGKFFSNGLDLEEMMRAGQEGATAYVGRVLGIVGRLFTCPAPTVAVVNGHAFGAGALLALAADVQLMRADRGYFCMPEVDLEVAFHPGMAALLLARVPARVAHDLVVTGARIGGAEAAARGVVDEALDEAALLPRAIAIAAARASKAGPAMGVLKRSLYPQVVEALARPLALG